MCWSRTWVPVAVVGMGVREVVRWRIGGAVRRE
jgi:hypothetical protein